MDKKEIIVALWRLENKLHEFTQIVGDIKNSKLCKCPADRDRIDAWTDNLQARAKAIFTDRELVEAYKDSPEINSILYRENKKRTEALMARVIDEAKTLMGCELNG